jgi:hypothetical protein
MGFGKRLRKAFKKIKPGKDKYRKTAGAVKNAYQNPTDMSARGQAAVRLSAAPIAGSQYIG